MSVAFCFLFDDVEHIVTYNVKSNMMLPAVGDNFVAELKISLLDDLLDVHPINSLDEFVEIKGVVKSREYTFWDQDGNSDTAECYVEFFISVESYEQGY